MANPEIAVNKHFNMLIVGKAGNNFALGEIRYETDPITVEEKYGKSDLSESFRIAKEMGAPYVFVMNVRKTDDYFKAIKTIKVHDFAYVAFASLYLSDTFIKALDGGLAHSFFAYFLGVLGRNSISTLIATDKHAKAFDDIDDFLAHMNSTVKTVQDAFTARAARRNLICVANNLDAHRYGAVALAAALCTSAIDKYPHHNDFGDVIFDIDSYDRPGDYAYFKQHADSTVTVENLVNSMIGGPEKVVFVTRILNYIRRSLDLSQFEGKNYTDYIRLAIARVLNAHLTMMKGHILNAYYIEDIQAYRSAPGAVTVLTRFTVWPIGCFESCTIEKEVNLI